MKYFIYIFILLYSISLFSNETSDKIGIYSTYNFYNHIIGFGKLPNVASCCPSYENSNDKGFSLGLFFQSPINEKLFWGVRAGYTKIQGQFLSEEYIGNALDLNLNTTEAISLHKLDINIDQFEFTPLITYKPFEIPILFNLGFPISYNFSSEYEQSETLTKPTNAFFSNKNRVRNYSKGSIPDLSNPIFNGMLSVNYKFDINDFSFFPEIAYSMGFNDIIKSEKWKINSLRLGFLLAYNFPTKKEIPPKINTVIHPILEPKILALGINKDGNEEDLLKFVVEEFLSRQLYPLLPYVFFEENSDEIPARYTYLLPSDTKNFDENKAFFDTDPMTVYYHLLNIIGKRMLDNPDASITITGYNSNQGTERNNTNLSKRRAEKVRDYLKNIWGIPESRMKLNWNNLPTKPTLGSDRDYIVENQRVEIFSENYNIIKPVFVYDTLRETSPPKLKILANVTSDNKIARWNIKAYQDGATGTKTILDKSGFSFNENDSEYLFDFKINKEAIPRTETPLKLSFQTTDIKDNKASDFDSIQVEQLTIRKKRLRKMNDREIDEYRLIMFDFDKPEIIEAHKKIFEIICENVKPESEIFIEGFTDRLGSDDYNLRLSRDRADMIKNIIPCKTSKIQAFGKGETLLFNNDVPEGRFYNRTVIIRVETPIKNE